MTVLKPSHRPAGAEVNEKYPPDLAQRRKLPVEEPAGAPTESGSRASQQAHQHREAQMEFEISTGTAEGGASVIAVTGELDLSNVDRLAEPVQDAVSEGQPLVLDLSPCTFIDSSGLRFVLQLHRELAANGKEMAVVVPDGQVRRLLYVTAIDQSIRVFPALDDAVAFLGASADFSDGQPSLSARSSGGTVNRLPPRHEWGPA